jgi:energy-coupling factor transporter ATP-binding protein EcfA2
MNEAHRSEREQMAGEQTVAEMPSRLVESWRRCEGYGVSLDAVEPVFTGSVDDESLFYESGHQVLAGLQETLAEEPVSLMLTDPYGLVLNRICGERGLVRALDRVYLAPGFDYSEREAGTTGLGLALADRAPSLVSADDHYATPLWGYTCAAVPVEDPVSGDLVGCVNLTTWSQRSYNLLLALAQTAAGNTQALMLARGRGRRPRPAPRGGVFHVRPAGSYGTDADVELSPAWRAASVAVRAALAAGRGVCVTGEQGVGKTTLLAAAYATVRPHDRILAARPPPPQDLRSWLSLWTPELDKPYTSIVVGHVDRLSSWVATELADIFAACGGTESSGGQQRPGIAVTAEVSGGIPGPLSEMVDVFVELPALRHRPDDIPPLVQHFGRQRRGHKTVFTSAAMRVLSAFHWPGNLAQLRDVVHAAVSRSEIVDVGDLPPEVFSGAGHKLTRIETLERDEIVRCLATPGVTVTQAAVELGMSRATLYRRISQYGLRTLLDETG